MIAGNEVCFAVRGCGPPNITVSFVNWPVSCGDSAEESNTVPRIPGLAESYPVGDLGMRYPKPGGCSGAPEGTGGNTKLTTVTDEEELASRWGRGLDAGRKLFSTGGDNVETTCVGCRES